MQQWLVADVVDRNQSLGVEGVDRTMESIDWGLLSTAADRWIPPVAQSSSGDVGGMVMAAVVLLALGLAGVVAWRTQLSSFVSSPFGRGSSDSATVEQEASSSVESTNTAGSAAADAEIGSISEQETAPERTDRELIIEILGEHEGRMKQANIVDETGWSKSKVSMLLSDMEDDDDISKLRVGRENIISLSGKEPEAAGSPFDDE